MYASHLALRPEGLNKLCEMDYNSEDSYDDIPLEPMILINDGEGVSQIFKYWDLKNIYKSN